MLRRLFTAASVVSLLLCVATILLWIRSYSFGSAVTWVPERGTVLVGMGTWRGRAGFYYQFWSGSKVSAQFSCEATPVTPTGNSLANPVLLDDGEGDIRIRRAGFVYATFLRPEFHVYFVGVPLLVIATALLILPVLWLKPSRRDPKMCKQCGYDLRASKDRCPECGTPIPVEAKA